MLIIVQCSRLVDHCSIPALFILLINPAITVCSFTRAARVHRHTANMVITIYYGQYRYGALSSSAVVFVQVKGLNGTFVVNSYNMSGPRTLITFDQGSHWRTLTPPVKYANDSSINCNKVITMRIIYNIFMKIILRDVRFHPKFNVIMSRNSI